MSFFPNASIGITGSPFPIYSTLIGGSDGTNLRSLLTDASGLLKENMTQWASTVLGVPTNFGTTPGAVIAGSVNASMFSGTTALTNTGGSLNVNLTGGSVTITGAVVGNLTNNNAAPAATNLGVLPAIAETAYGTITYTTGNQVLPVTDLHGALNQDLQAYAGTQLTGTVTAYGAAPTGNVFGVNAFITNTVPVTLASTTITGTVAVTQSTSPWVVSLASTTITNTVAENLTQVAGVVLGATAVTAFGTAPAAANVPGVNASLFSGTTALTNTAGALNVSMTSTTVTGTVVVVGNKSNNAVAPGATNLGVLPAIANAASPAWTEGNEVLLSVDLSGRSRTRGTLTANTAAPSSDGQMTLTVVANAASPSYTEGNLVLASVDLNGATRIVGTRTNNNAAPSLNIGVLPALANAAAPTWTEGNQVLLSVDLSGNLRTTPTTTTGAAAADVTAVGNPVLVAGVDGSGNIQEFPVADTGSTAPAQTLIIGGVFNTALPTLTNGQAGQMQLDAKGQLLVDLNYVAGNIIATSASGIMKVGINSGPDGTALSQQNAGASPLSSVAVGGNYQSAPFALVSTKFAMLQIDSAGDLFVRPYRRSQVVRQATTISNSSAATTVLAAQAASVFSDITNLIITVTPGATTDLAFTATLSDGTISYIYDMDTGALATATADPTIINIHFLPPLPATTAATAWTIQLSAALATSPVHITVVAVIGLAN